MNRRKFFGILGVGSAFVTAPVVAYAATRVAPEKKPPGQNKYNTLVLQGASDDDVVKHNGTTIGYYQSPNKPRPQVRMAAGHDNYLWIEINNEWKRVVVE